MTTDDRTHSSRSRLGRVREAPRLLDLIHARDKHPSYQLDWGFRNPGEVVYTAIAQVPDVHPVVVMSHTLGELLASLDPCDLAPVAPVIELPTDRRMST